MADVELCRAAARANAAWCDAVARAVGLAPESSERVWWSAIRTPVGFPDAVTLDPETSTDEILTLIDAGPGASVKDSFTGVDLTVEGFAVLFDAQWIHHGSVGSRSPRLAWAPVTDGDGLARWGADYDLDLPPRLVADPAVCVLGGEGGAGFVLNPCGEGVGVGCVHAGRLDPDAVWADVAAVAAERFPGLELLGYEHGTDLDLAARAGFRRIGPLRIWLRP